MVPGKPYQIAEIMELIDATNQLDTDDYNMPLSGLDARWEVNFRRLLARDAADWRQPLHRVYYGWYAR